MKAVALVPFGYAVVTRLNTPRDFLYLVATQWIPGIWLVHRLGEVDLAEAALLYAAGYLAFIALYEIGYLVNDTWDARRQPDGRHRFSHGIGPGYAVVFVAIRVVIWAGVSFAWGQLGNPDWLALSAALAASFVLHNLIVQNYLRIASFTQLTFLRFSIPILFGLDASHFLTVNLICVLFYFNFRFLAYLDAKNFLNMPERKYKHFGVAQTVSFLPFVTILSLKTNSILYIEILIYFTFIYGVYSRKLK